MKKIIALLGLLALAFGILSTLKWRDDHAC